MTASALEDAVTVSVGGVAVTVSGMLALAVTAAPVAGATFAARLRVAAPAVALEPPFSVSVHTTLPAAVRLGALHAATIPLGNPAAIVMVDPAAPAAGFSPPVGVAVTVAVALPIDCIDTETGETASVIPGACVTASVIWLLAVRPLPAAVTVKTEEAIFAVGDAVSVSVSAADPALEGVTGLADQAADTPDGSPLMLHVMAPLNDPPVAAARLTLVVEPSPTEEVDTVGDTLSVGGCVTVIT